MTSVAAWFLKKAQHRRIAALCLLMIAALALFNLVALWTVGPTRFDVTDANTRLFISAVAYSFLIWAFFTGHRVLRSLPRNDDAACDLLLLGERSFLNIFLARFLAYISEWLLVLAALLPVSIALHVPKLQGASLALFQTEVAIIGVAGLLIVPWYMTCHRGRVFRMAVYLAVTAFALYELLALRTPAQHGVWLLAYGAFLLAFAAATPGERKNALSIAVKGARVSPGSLIQFLGFGLSPLPRVIVHPLIETALIALIGIALLLFAPYGALAFLVIGPIASAGYMNQIVASGKIDDLRLAAVPFTRIARAMQAACLLRGLVFSLIALAAIAYLSIGFAIETSAWAMCALAGTTAVIMYVSVLGLALKYGALRNAFLLSGAGASVGVYMVTASFGVLVLALVDALGAHHPWLAPAALITTALIHLLIAVHAFLRFPAHLYCAYAALGAWLSSSEMSARKYDLAILQWQDPMRDES